MNNTNGRGSVPHLNWLAQRSEDNARMRSGAASRETRDRLDREQEESLRAQGVGVRTSKTEWEDKTMTTTIPATIIAYSCGCRSLAVDDGLGGAVDPGIVGFPGVRCPDHTPTAEEA